jgi:LmbE family N-acetylglucosaminyl deacetylase
VVIPTALDVRIGTTRHRDVELRNVPDRIPLSRKTNTPCSIMSWINGRIEDTTALDALCTGATIPLRAVVVVAHPDDETIAMGGRLPLLANLTLIHLTDGSPRTLDDARRTGHATRGTYAVTREREAVHALCKLGIVPKRLRYGAPDQEAARRLPELIEALTRHLLDAELVVTHPYEGGHPDHDTAACAVQLACDRIARAGGCPPLRLEFASYHSRRARLYAGGFWPEPGCRDVTVHLPAEARARKHAALACYRSQSAVIAWFDPGVEHYRRAPRYDFAQRPPPGTCLYDSFGWPLTSAHWRTATRPVLAHFALEPA